MKSHLIVLLSLFCFAASAQFELHLKPNAADGFDALLLDHTIYTTINFGANPQEFYHAGTSGGINNFGRSLIQFDFSSIPPPNRAVIDSAYLSMFAWNQTSGTGPHSWASGSNVGWVERVTSPWEEMVVTWATQPTTTQINRMPIDSAQAPDKDYPRIYVTQLVKDIVNNFNYGFMFRLQTEVRYRGVNFCSSDHVDPNKWPEIHIYATYCPEDTVSATICEGDSIYAEKEWQKTAGLYIDTFPLMGGCDSIVYTDVNIYNLNCFVAQVGNSLFASGTGSFFQWLDCGTNMVLTPVTIATYTPSVAGYYAAINILGNCRDTSECVFYQPTGIENVEEETLKIMPVPTYDGRIKVISDACISMLEIHDMRGQLKFTRTLNNLKTTELDLSAFPKGIYFLKVITDRQINVKRIVKE